MNDESNDTYDDTSADTDVTDDIVSDEGADLNAGTLEPANVGESESGGDSKGFLSRLGHGTMAGVVAATSIYDDAHLDAIQNNPLINKPTSETEIVTEAPAAFTERMNQFEKIQELVEQGEPVDLNNA